MYITTINLAIQQSLITASVRRPIRQATQSWRRAAKLPCIGQFGGISTFVYLMDYQLESFDWTNSRLLPNLYKITVDLLQCHKQHLPESCLC